MSDHSVDRRPANTGSKRTADELHLRAKDSPWPAMAASLIAVTVLTTLHLSHADRGWQAENSLLILSVAIVAAWFTPVGFAFVLPLITFTIWTVVDIQNEPAGWAYPFGCLVRFSLSVLLVCWVSRARQQLDQALQSARIDNLTGISNRLAILEHLEVELGRVRRFGRTFSIAVIDCDGFKKINDLCGHLAGDQCLRRIAALLQSHIRCYDHVGRLGGDEFVLILSEANVEEARGVIERIREELQTDLKRDYPSLSFSVGVATIEQSGHRSNLPLDWFECLQGADDAMYRAKRSGNNRTEYTTLNIGI